MVDKKRIFVAINFNNNFKENLISIQNKINACFLDTNPIKWTKKENLHLTLFFIGYIYDRDLMDVFNETEKVVQNYNDFSINFNEIDFFPRKGRNKKMVWVFGENNQILNQLQEDLKTKLLGGNNYTKGFIPHITLGRISTFDFKKINPEEIPQINDEIFIDSEIRVSSIDIMESELKKGGVHYTLLKSFKL